MTDYKKLQNGSDIRGVAISGVAGETVNLTPVEAAYIGKAFIRWLRGGDSESADKLTVSIGCD